MVEKRPSKTSSNKEAMVKGRKRQKVTHEERPLDIVEAQKERKRGILERIMDVPVDILCEILSHLSPWDLLSLTKASKDLEAFLLDDAYLSTQVWQQARTLQEPKLPPLPRGFTEYEYANLVFDTHCHECEKPLSRYVLWAAKVRLCGRCLEDRRITSFATPPIWLDPILREVSRHPNPKWGRNPWTRRAGISACTPHIWYLNGANKLMAQLEALKLTGDDAKIQEWLSEKKSEAEDGIKLCEALDAFTAFMENRRFDELRSLREERKRSVLERLNAAGWAEELAYENTILAINTNDHVDQPKVLTDKAWANIEPILTSHLKKIRAQIKISHVLDARHALFSKEYDSLIRSLPFLPPLPPSNDVLRYAPFQNLIFETPPNQGTLGLKDRLEWAFRLHWDSIHAEWRGIHEGTLKSMLVHSQSSSDDLNLAINAFECDDCSALVNYPHVLVHWCYRSQEGRSNSYRSRIEAGRSRSDSLKSFYEVPDYWTRRQLEGVIVACGLDPASATTREMDLLDVLVLRSLQQGYKAGSSFARFDKGYAME